MSAPEQTKPHPAVPRGRPEEVESGSEAAVVDAAPAEPLIDLGLADCDAIAGLRNELGVSDVVAQVLVRRGYGEPTAARRFLAGGEPHRDSDLPGAESAAERLAVQIEAGTPIAVHGDYDADGVCSTALLVSALARLGAEVTWHVPDRFADGYGLGADALRRFAENGAGLVVAVDCGVTAVAEAELARELGLELIILDHHERDARLPDATIAHPALGDYQNPQLCATAVAWKTMRLLYERLGAETSPVDRDVELAGLATVTDVMPLTGENRWLVSRAIETMRLTERPGLRELMRVAGVDPLSLDASSFGFRIGPRLNAAGRMGSADAAVELLLTGNQERAALLAERLHGLNAQRQEIEREVLWQAQEQADAQTDGYAIVVAGEGWHGGVVGIVAGRLAQRHRRPCVVLTVDGDTVEGSARGGGRYDLIAGLRACDEHLLRYGGHAAAAGLALDRSRLEAFRAALRDHAASVLSPDDLRPRHNVDAIVGTGDLTLDTAEQLARLGPYGNGNPEPVLAIASVDVETAGRMGTASQHARLSLAGPDGRSRAVAFDWRAVKPAGDGPWHGHVVARLRTNHWNGAVEAQVQVESILPYELSKPPTLGLAGWQELFALEHASPLTGDEHGVHEPPLRETDRRGTAALAPVCELAGAGLPVHLICRDAGRWLEVAPAAEALGVDAGLVSVEPYSRLGQLPHDDAIVLAEPPLHAAELHQLGARRGHVVAAWDKIDAAAQQQAIDAAFCAREYVAAFWRLLDGADEVAVEQLPQMAAAAGIRWLDPVTAGRMARVLGEVGLLTLIPSAGAAETIRVRRDLRVELDRSEAFRSYSEIRKQAAQCLSQLTK